MFVGFVSVSCAVQMEFITNNPPFRAQNVPEVTLIIASCDIHSHQRIAGLLIVD